MKSVLIALLVIYFNTPSHAQTIKYNGYYYAFADAYHDSSWHYLRFYPDGTVIEINSIARPGKLMASFKKDISPNLMQGSFTVNGNELQFSLANQMKQRTVYKGTVENDILKLRLHSFATGLDTDETFRYVRIEDME